MSQGGFITDISGSIANGGAAQTVVAAKANRRYFFFLNISDTDMWIDFGTAAVADQPSIKVPANGGYFEPLIAPVQSVSVMCATTGKKFVAKELNY